MGATAAKVILLMRSGAYTLPCTSHVAAGVYHGRGYDGNGAGDNGSYYHPSAGGGGAAAWHNRGRWWGLLGMHISAAATLACCMAALPDTPQCHACT